LGSIDVIHRKRDSQMLGIQFGNENWNGSRGGTLVTKLDLIIDDIGYSSVPAKNRTSNHEFSPLALGRE
jgi:hypothetical protein